MFNAFFPNSKIAYHIGDFVLSILIFNTFRKCNLILCTQITYININFDSKEAPLKFYIITWL